MSFSSFQFCTSTAFIGHAGLLGDSPKRRTAVALLVVPMKQVVAQQPFGESRHTRLVEYRVRSCFQNDRSEMEGDERLLIAMGRYRTQQRERLNNVPQVEPNNIDQSDSRTAEGHSNQLLSMLSDRTWTAVSLAMLRTERLRPLCWFLLPTWS